MISIIILKNLLELLKMTIKTVFPIKIKGGAMCIIFPGTEAKEKQVKPNKFL